MCFVWISEQTVAFALYISKRWVFITEVESVYCAVRTEHITQIRLVLKGLKRREGQLRRTKMILRAALKSTIRFSKAYFER